MLSKAASTESVAGAFAKQPKFTANNYRKNLMKFTGERPPSNIEAHHVFSQKQRGFFLSKGINIDDPQYCTWWERSTHRSAASGYNNQWSEFRTRSPNATVEEIFQFGRELISGYGIKTNY